MEFLQMERKTQTSFRKLFITTVHTTGEVLNIVAHAMSCT